MNTDPKDAIKNLDEQYRKYLKNEYPIRMEPFRVAVLRELKARIEKYVNQNQEIAHE